MEPEGSLSCSQEPGTGPIMSQFNPIRTSYFFNVHFNIIPYLRFIFQAGSSFQDLRLKFCIHFSSPVRSTCPPISSSLILSPYLVKSTITKIFIMQNSPYFWYFLSLVSKYSPQHSVVIHPQLCSSRWMRDQVSHPCRTANKFTVFFEFIDGKRKKLF
jgi:hypothetical protein